MSNSSLVTYTNLSPNKNSPRTSNIDTITIHCVVGQWTAKQIADYFSSSTVGASCNYGVGKDGSISLVVDEGNRSWCSSDRTNDHRAITIEVASDTTDPYAVTDEAYNALITLCADICKRNGIDSLKWQADSSLNGQVDKQNMSAHRWFKAKACPGEFLYSRFGDVANKVNEILNPTPDEEIEIDEEEIEMRYNTVEEIKSAFPNASVYSETVQKVIDKGILQGGSNGLNLTEDMIRMFVFNDRSGMYN